MMGQSTVHISRVGSMVRGSCSELKEVNATTMAKSVKF